MERGSSCWVELKEQLSSFGYLETDHHQFLGVPRSNLNPPPSLSSSSPAPRRFVGLVYFVQNFRNCESHYIFISVYTSRRPLPQDSGLVQPPPTPTTRTVLRSKYTRILTWDYHVPQRHCYYHIL